jgi:DNA (cytosine-5)-methyltransferase 1
VWLWTSKEGNGCYLPVIGTKKVTSGESMQSTHKSIKDASIFLSLTEQQVRNLCRDGKLSAEKFGGIWVISDQVLADYVSSHPCGNAQNQSAERPLIKEKPIALSFFSGALGMDIGLGNAGFDVRLCCEVDNACRKTIHKNHPERALIGDIREYTPRDVRKAAGLEASDDIDLVVGGPPCQAFSTAGRRKGLADARGNLITVYLEMILGLMPKYAVLENVRGILSAAMSVDDYGSSSLKTDKMYPGVAGGVMRYIIDQLESHGYGVSFNLYNAANFGTPQLRERVIIVASRDGKRQPFLNPTHSQFGEQGFLSWVTLREALAGMQEGEQHYIPFPEKRLRFYRLLKPGQNWRALSEDLRKEAMGNAYYSGGGKSGFFRRLDWNRPSPTLVTHPAMPATDLAHPEQDRPLSVEEYMRIQQFPADWKIEGSIIERYRQIGNAVPVGLGYAIGRHLLDLELGKPVCVPPDFKFSRYSFTDHLSWDLQWLQAVRISEQMRAL